MTPRQTRAVLLAAGFIILGLTAFLALTALEDNLVYFRTPTELATGQAIPGQRVRIGGLVGLESLQRDGLSSRFIVTDQQHDIKVSYQGILPDLFREGQGVVAEGVFTSEGIFVADTVLAKHDENYMPQEVAEALKQSGVWQGEVQ